MLRSENKAKRTIEKYTDSARFYADYLEVTGRMRPVEEITRDDVGELTVDSIDLDHDTVTVLGKGSRPRVLPLPSTSLALARYLRLRKAEKWAERTQFRILWPAYEGGPCLRSRVCTAHEMARTWPS